MRCFVALFLVLVGIFCLSRADAVNLHVGTGRALLGGNSNPPPFLSDAAAIPWNQPLAVPAAIYVPSTTTYWFFWEGWQPYLGTPQKVDEVATYNSTTGQWSGNNYLVGTNTLVNDIHGVPTVVRDASGCVYDFYGAHGNNVRWSATVTPDVPTDWVQGSFSTVSGTFVHPVLVGSTIYLFIVGTGAGAGIQEAFKLSTVTTSNCSPSASAMTTIFDLNDANNSNAGWFLPGNMIVENTDIHMTWNYGLNDGLPKLDVYYGIYDTLTGDMCNYGKSTCIAPGSWPISLATMQSTFRVVDQIDNSQQGMASAFNVVNGVDYIVYASQPGSDTSPVSANPILYEIHNSGSGWSSPYQFYQYFNNTDPYNLMAAIVDNGTGGGIDIYWPDGASGYTSVSFGGLGQGNIRKTTRNASGVWNGVSIAAAIPKNAGNYGLSDPFAIQGALPAARVIFGQVSNDTTTSVGGLLGYALGDNGFLRRPTPFILPIYTSLDPATISSTLTLSQANLKATATGTSQPQGQIARSLSAKSSGLYYYEFVTAFGTGHAVASGLITAAQNIMTNACILGCSGNTSIGWFNSGAVEINGSSIGSKGSYGSGGINRIAVDFGHQTIWFATCAGNWNGSGTANPVTNTGGVSFSALGSGPFYLGVQINTSADAVSINPSGLHSCVPPAGFVDWNFLLNRDLDPSANDNSPAWLSKAA